MTIVFVHSCFIYMVLFYAKIGLMRSLDEVLADLKKAEKEFADKLEEFEAKQKAFEEAQSLNGSNESRKDESGS